MEYDIKYVECEAELERVLRLCYEILGQNTAENPLYCPGAWRERMKDYGKLLIYAQSKEGAVLSGNVISLVLGRPESSESLVCGCVACAEKYRMQGITKKLMERFEENAKDMGFSYITLGAADDAVGFYEKCGYQQDCGGARAKDFSESIVGAFAMTEAILIEANLP